MWSGLVLAVLLLSTAPQASAQAAPLFFDNFENAATGSLPRGWLPRNPEPTTFQYINFTVEVDSTQGRVLKANSCSFSGNAFTAGTFECTPSAPCSISFLVRKGTGGIAWQGLANDFPGSHSWIGGASRIVPERPISLFAGGWTQVSYVWPPIDHSGIHNWVCGIEGDFTAHRMMVQASGSPASSCRTVKFDQFCVCRTTYATGVVNCCNGLSAPTAPPPAMPTPPPGFTGTPAPTFADPVCSRTPDGATRTPTVQASAAPSSQPPTRLPTRTPTTRAPTSRPPTRSPTRTPTTQSPTRLPTRTPSTRAPTSRPPTRSPTRTPTRSPTRLPTRTPTTRPPTSAPSTGAPVTSGPTAVPTAAPSATPTVSPTALPSTVPTETPSATPTLTPTTAAPTGGPTEPPTAAPTFTPTATPSTTPTATPTAPTAAPTSPPTPAPTRLPTAAPSAAPTASPTVVAASVGASGGGGGSGAAVIAAVAAVAVALLLVGVVARRNRKAESYRGAESQGKHGVITNPVYTGGRARSVSVVGSNHVVYAVPLAQGETELAEGAVYYSTPLEVQGTGGGQSTVYDAPGQHHGERVPTENGYTTPSALGTPALPEGYSTPSSLTLPEGYSTPGSLGGPNAVQGTGAAAYSTPSSLGDPNAVQTASAPAYSTPGSLGPHDSKDPNHEKESPTRKHNGGGNVYAEPASIAVLGGDGVTYAVPTAGGVGDHVYSSVPGALSGAATAEQPYLEPVGGGLTHPEASYNLFCGPGTAVAPTAADPRYDVAELMPKGPHAYDAPLAAAITPSAATSSAQASNTLPGSAAAALVYDRPTESEATTAPPPSGEYDEPLAVAVDTLPPASSA